MVLINLKQQVNASTQLVRETLLEHEKLDRFFNAEFALIKSEDKGEIKGGKGAIRQVMMSGLIFEEQIISADDNHIRYQILGNKPVANHCGHIHFQQSDELNPQTEITYEIRCKAPWWIPSFVLGFFIKKDIKQALKKLALNFS